MRRGTALLALTIYAWFQFGAAANAAAPQVADVKVTEVTNASATMRAEINPQGKATSYRFEYGLAPCSANPCISASATEGQLPTGSSPLQVEAPVEGLEAATLYYYRVIAKNGETTTSADRVFATYSEPLEGLAGDRVYELSSPLDKDGGDATGEFSLVKATASGDGITFGSAFGLPGGKGAQALPLYLARRSAGTWSTRGLLPPANFGERAQVMGWSPNYEETFAKVTKLGPPRTEAFLVESTTTGAVTLIAPYTPGGGYFYVGSSEDGSTVFFEARVALPAKAGQGPIPAAIDGASNLYAWERSTGELHLASMGNNGQSPPKGAFAGPYDWSAGTTAQTLRQGGAERRYYLSGIHAIDAEGDIYFTEASSGQLFLRLNPTASQSSIDGQGQCTKASEACTIHVSASQKTDGNGPGGTDAGGPQPAAFAAASTDGSKVFFTSVEKLTNDANTGPEQPLAAIGRGGIAGGIDSKEFIPEKAVGVTVDGSNIYWADPVGGAIGRANLDGTGVDKSFIVPGPSECEEETEPGVFSPVVAPSKPRYVAADNVHIYWTNTGALDENGEPLDGGGTIGRADIDGTNVDPDFICDASNPEGIGVNATHVYWANAAKSSLRRSIGRATIDGGTVEQEFFKVEGNGVSPAGVALSPTHVYFGFNELGNDGGYIGRVPLAGGSPDLSFIGKKGIRGIALDASSVYWATQGEDAIGRANLEFENKEKEFIKLEGKPNGLAADAAHLYWAVNGESPSNPGNDLYRYEPASGNLSDLTPLEGGSGAEVQGVLGTSEDGSVLYFAANGDLDGAGPAATGSCHTSQPHGSLATTSGACGIYRWQEGTVSFVAQVKGGSEATGLNWVGTPRELFGSGSYVAKVSLVSPDGKTLLFLSREKLTDYDSGGIPEIYRYRVGDPEAIRCVSCRPNGEAANSGPSIGSINFPGLRPSDSEATATRNLSADGDRAFFETADALSPLDTNGKADVYEWNAAETGSCKVGSRSYSLLNSGCIYLVSTGKSEFPSLLADASASGDDVFFYTREQLVGQDEDELQDVYDARVGGGIASQNPSPVIACESATSCREGGQLQPSENTPGTQEFSGPGDPKPKHKAHKRKAKKGKAKSKKHKHRKHGKKRVAATGRPITEPSAGAKSSPTIGTATVATQSPSSSPASKGADTSAAPQATPAPAWALTITPMPADFPTAGGGEYQVIATDVGAAPTTGETTTLETVLPTGLVPTAVQPINSDPSASAPPTCSIVAQLVTCETAETVGPGRRLVAKITVEVNAPEGTYEAEAKVSGGGAAQEVSATLPTEVRASPSPFDFLPGFQAPLNNDDGAPTVLAGSHPYQQTIAFGFPTESAGNQLTNAGHPHDLYVDLPPGLTGSPAATPVLCTEAQLTTHKCPDASQVGVTDITSLLGAVGVNVVYTDNLYNMVPPPGVVAELATDVNVAGIFVHIQAGIRSDSDYGVQTRTRDMLAFGQQPIFSVQAQIWGDPSAAAHDRIRGNCTQAAGACPVTSRDVAFLTMPSDCTGQPLPFAARADTWEEPASDGFEERQTTYESADLVGDQVTVEDCGGLDFEPTIDAKPTTNVADSPAGLRFTLHQPQDTRLGFRSPSTLKNAVVRFPAGLAINPAQAVGLGTCTQGEIGFLGAGDGGEMRFSKAPQSCPDSAKIGTVEVTSPALVARNSDHEVEEQEEEPVLRPLHGSLYVAKPFENPFGTLVAAYMAIEDRRTGIVAKLGGEAELDPQTGQITARFEHNPQIPIEDIEVKVFGGSGGSFVAPPTCGTYSTGANLTPWSSPAGPDAHPESSFSVDVSPDGGACPITAGQMPNAPALTAGMLAPVAGKFSPLLFKLARADGSQRLAKIDVGLPAGLSAKLAGVGTCSEVDIAKARSRETSNQGTVEQVDPSCPASSKLGTAIAAAGAGPNPLYVTGQVYLAGPYKGAPLSVVTIAPAVTGPFDLGAVVVRSALFLDPVTAQGRIASDPLPQILHGVPVDLRSVAIRIDRPGFTLNPTSCAEKAISVQVTSPLGAAANLTRRFQVGGCSSLPFKPTFSARLFGPTNRGAHPALRAHFGAKGLAEASTRAISFTFPRSEFIDQAHFRTICTRVQFAANQCPPGSVYGQVRVLTPLLDYPLEGPVYLRSSSHKLPDVVLSLKGPAYQPIALEAAGRVDSVKGGLRVRFTGLPDAPISKVLFTAQGASKGLFQNSTNICKGTHRGTLFLEAQNGKVHDSRPVIKAKCGRKHRSK